MNEKRKFRKKMVVIIALFVVFIAISSKTKLQITEAKFWLAFAMGGLCFSFVSSLVVYFKRR